MTTSRDGGRVVCASLIAMCCVLQGCLLQRSGVAAEECVADSDCGPGALCLAGGCREVDRDAGPRDAGPTDGDVPDARMADAGLDSGPVDSGLLDSGFPDAGPPAHCTNGTLDPGVETDVDCGRDCPACGMCRLCATNGDCRNGTCDSGTCAAELTTVSTTAGDRPAFVREDGAILLAYYAPGTYPAGFDITQSQQATPTGGPAAPPGWAPTPCGDPGHLPYADFAPSERTVTLECGTGYSDIHQSVDSTLFSTFAEGTRGAPGTSGSPGWAVIASVGSGEGRAGGAMCGTRESVPEAGGIAYCDGTRTTGYDNHLVSFSVAGSGNPFVGCGGGGCNASRCELGVWVWLTP